MLKLTKVVNINICNNKVIKVQRNMTRIYIQHSHLECAKRMWCKNKRLSDYKYSNILHFDIDLNAAATSELTCEREKY